MNHQHTAGFIRCRDHFLKLFRRHGYGFLADDMLAGLQRADGNFFMDIVRCSNQYNLDSGISKHFLIAHISLVSCCLRRFLPCPQRVK
ncbi:hypothetical protein D3C85_1644910 [compost metagenome]